MRFKDVEWEAEHADTHEAIQVQLLMDIRDEIKALRKGTGDEIKSLSKVLHSLIERQRSYEWILKEELRKVRLIAKKRLK